jgi:hypothetical protein
VKPHGISRSTTLKIYLPETALGELAKDAWTDARREFTTEYEDDPCLLPVYPEGSQRTEDDPRYTGPGVVGYLAGETVFEGKGSRGGYKKCELALYTQFYDTRTIYQ